MPKQVTTRRTPHEARIRVLLAQLTTTHSELAPLVSKIDLIHLKNVSDRENAKKYNTIGLDIYSNFVCNIIHLSEDVLS